jgi:pilus assembly protein FimV
MQFNHRPPIVSSALKTLTAAVASAVLLSSAHAAGLGKLTVLSALGQPLRAEIELTAVSNEEASGLVAKLATPDAFRVANIDFNPALLSLRFAVEQRNGRQFIRISSTQPLNEPFVDMLLELSWNNGRLVREYTFLLDPAELRATQPAQVAAAPVERARAEAPVARPAEQVAPVTPAAPKARAPQGAEKSAPASGARAPAAAEQYRVKPGDTLGHIAAQLKPVDISLDMMLVALYRANPDAFIGNNMNRLKSGQILSVPDSDAIHGIGEGQARGIVIAHAADFNAYRNKLAGQVATSAPVKAPTASQSAAGKITAKVQERPTAANEAQDQLRLSKAVPGAAGKGATTASTEDAIAKEKALVEAQARVKELERNVSDLEKLMTVKNKGAAEAVGNASQPPVAAAKPVPVAPTVKPAPVKPAKPTLARTPKKTAPAEPGFADMLMDNIAYVGAGAAVLLLALLGLSQRRRRKDVVKPVPETSILGVPSEPAHSLFAEQGGQSVDTNNSVFHSSFAPSASQLDTNEVDPVAEADVYIAYGRDAQAEEILKEALRSHPERHPVRLKLLEIYAARKDQRAFETQASQLYSQTRGQGDEWEQAVALGLSIDPLNPLYAPSDATATAQPAPAENTDQTLLAQQLEDAFRAGDADPAQGLLADAAPTALPDTAGTAAAKADEHVLDFDLGGLSFEPVSTTEPIAMPGPDAAQAKDDAVHDLDFNLEPTPVPDAVADAEAAEAEPQAPKLEEEPFDLSFDMNFDAPAAPQESAAPAPKHDELALDLSPGAPSSDAGMADLAREFDLPPLPQAAQESTAAAELKDPLFDLDAMDFSMPAVPAPVQENPVPQPKDPLFDFDAMQLEPPTAHAVAAPASEQGEDPFALPAHAAAAPQFDMSDIDLELPPAEEGALPLPEVGTVELSPGELSAAHMEMETKLDLAIAYQEIGDKEGARELLDEVIKGGSSEQVNKASAMRAKLA